MTVRAFANLPGEMARRIREMDWSASPLGSSEVWPQSLKLSIAMILASGFPMAIRWGPELVLIYNDAYRPILCDKHPEALGRSLREVWWEVYPELGPLNEAILRGEREAFFAEDLRGPSAARAGLSRMLGLPSATARSRTKRRRTGSAAFLRPASKRPSAAAKRRHYAF
jgi:hypothetical protein